MMRSIRKQKQPQKQCRHKDKGVMVREKHSQLETPPNINPFTPMSGTIHWPLHKGHPRSTPLHFGTKCNLTHAALCKSAWMDLQIFGALYCQPQQTAQSYFTLATESGGRGLV